MSGDLGNSKRSCRRVECRRDDNTSDVVDWHHVDRVVDVWTSRQLDTSLDHSDQEVIGVRSWVIR